jgi:hypothetical protein
MFEITPAAPRISIGCDDHTTPILLIKDGKVIIDTCVNIGTMS